MTRIDEDALSAAKDRWNTIHSNYVRKDIHYDDWLGLFEGVISDCQTPILDLGCGSGNDTLYLLGKEKRVIPCDYSKAAIQNIIKNLPEIERAECFDMTDGLPFADNFTDLVIADLSLHYFSEIVTCKVVDEIKRILKPDGILLFRVNSINDVFYGAGMGEEVERHLYKTNEMGYKRFFDHEDILVFFSGWDLFYVNEEGLERYEKPKKLWRCAARVMK